MWIARAARPRTGSGVWTSPKRAECQRPGRPLPFLRLHVAPPRVEPLPSPQRLSERLPSPRLLSRRRRALSRRVQLRPSPRLPFLRRHARWRLAGLPLVRLRLARLLHVPFPFARPALARLPHAPLPFARLALARLPHAAQQPSPQQP